MQRKDFLSMKHIFTRMICLSTAALYLSGCSGIHSLIEPIMPEEPTSVLETTMAVTEAEPVFERIPDDYFLNFKPLAMNVFAGSEIACDSEVYAAQVEVIDKIIAFVYGENYTPGLEAKLLTAALLSNRNLAYKYKKWLFHMIEYFEDNPYLEREEIYEKLLTLNIETQTFGEDDEGFFYGAETIPDENKIIFYIILTDELVESHMSSTGYEETGLTYVDFDAYDSLKHEIFHMTTSSEVDTLNGFINEGMTMLLEKEYNRGDIASAYDQRIMYLKMMMEVIGKDAVLEAYSKGDWSVLEAALLNLDPDPYKPERICELMYEWGDEWEKADCDFELVLEYTEDIRSEMAELMTEYYRMVYPDTDENAMYFIYERMFAVGPDDSLYGRAEACFNTRYEEDRLIRWLY